MLLDVFLRDPAPGPVPWTCVDVDADLAREPADRRRRRRQRPSAALLAHVERAGRRCLRRLRALRRLASLAWLGRLGTSSAVEARGGIETTFCSWALGCS